MVVKCAEELEVASEDGYKDAHCHEVGEDDADVEFLPMLRPRYLFVQDYYQNGNRILCPQEE